MKAENVAGSSLIGEVEELLGVVAARDDYNGAVDLTRDKLEKLRQRQEQGCRIVESAWQPNFFAWQSA